MLMHTLYEYYAQYKNIKNTNTLTLVKNRVRSPVRIIFIIPPRISFLACKY